MVKKQHYSLKHKMSSLFMLFMLAWLSVCLPYVIEDGQSTKAQIHLAGEEIPDSEESSLPVNTNEEKSEGDVSLLSGYLQHLFQWENSFSDLTAVYKIHAAGLYHAYHPELVIPPPEA